MELSTVDPYEQKLYNMFNSFDVQHLGSLDRDSLANLCTTLELKDRGPKLVARLITNSDSRVTFREFKEGLLNLLGTDDKTEGKPPIFDIFMFPFIHQRTTMREKCNIIVKSFRIKNEIYLIVNRSSQQIFSVN